MNNLIFSMILIDTANLVSTALQFSRQGTSGYFSKDQMNKNISAVEDDVIKIYTSVFEATRIVSNDISNLIKRVQMDAIGSFPSDYEYITFLENKSSGKSSVFPILHHQVNEIKDNYVRRPENSGQSYYYLEDGKVVVLKPNQSDKIDMHYISKPKYGSVKYSYSEGDGDYVTIETDSPMQWSQSCFNLFLYKLLSVMGFEDKDQLQMEYARIGYTTELTKLNNVDQ